MDIGKDIDRRNNGKIVIKPNYDIKSGITSNELNLKDIVVLLN